MEESEVWTQLFPRNLSMFGTVRIRPMGRYAGSRCYSINYRRELQMNFICRVYTTFTFLLIRSQKKRKRELRNNMGLSLFCRKIQKQMGGAALPYNKYETSKQSDELSLGSRPSPL